MRKIWIDCDTGTDDAVALLSALHWQKDFVILGFSAVSGNVLIDHTFPNTRNVVALGGGEKIPVYRGADKPLYREAVIADYIHGANGLNGAFIPDSLAQVETLEAWQAMAKMIEKYPNELNLIAVGPLTNIALLLQNRPDLAAKIQQILIMGGAIQGGNITPQAEFNIYVDPEAANIVFSSGVNVVMFGLDVTEKGYLNKEEFLLCYEANNAKGKLFAAMFSQQRQEFTEASLREKYFHDVNPILYLRHPEYYEGEDTAVRVVCEAGALLGKTVIHPEIPHHNTKVIYRVKRHAFAQAIIDVICGENIS